MHIPAAMSPSAQGLKLREDCMRRRSTAKRLSFTLLMLAFVWALAIAPALLSMAAAQSSSAPQATGGKEGQPARFTFHGALNWA